MSGGKLPRFIVIKQSNYDVYVRYRDEEGEPDFRYPVLGGDSVFDTRAKIEVEPSKTGDSNHVHLRFCHSNKYFQRDDYLIFAKSNQPEEDTSKPSCTLFKPTIVNDQGLFYLEHVHSGWRVAVKGIYLNVYQNPDQVSTEDKNFYYLDWDTLVKLPEHVAFKGDNGKYLQAFWYDHEFLMFKGDDPNDARMGNTVSLMDDGHVRIKNDHWGKFWRRSPNWIWADTTDTTANNRDTLFWPVKIDDTTIALRNEGNNNFCQRLTADGKESCLNAAASRMVNEAKLTVQELVSQRKIYNVRYRMEDARIFNETPFAAGTTTAFNNSDSEAGIAVEVGYEDSKSYSFSRSVSLTAGVTTSIEVGVPLIEKGTIEVSYEINTTLEWNNTTTSTVGVKATGSVPVPPRSVATVRYVGTMGTCDVPFSYTQQDTSSADGKVIQSEQIDGVFRGVNAYNFSFVIDKIEPLA